MYILDPIHINVKHWPLVFEVPQMDVKWDLCVIPFVFNFLCLVCVSAPSLSLNAIALYLSVVLCVLPCVSECWAVFLCAQAWLLWMVVWAAEVSRTARAVLWRLWLRQPILGSSNMPLPLCPASTVRVYCPSRTLVPLAARGKVSTWKIWALSCFSGWEIAPAYV